VSIHIVMAVNGLCADVPLRNYSSTVLQQIQVVEFESYSVSRAWCDVNIHCQTSDKLRRLRPYLSDILRQPLLSLCHRCTGRTDPARRDPRRDRGAGTVGSGVK